MLNRRFVLETATIVVAAVLCAAISNSLAARERKVKWLATSSSTPKRVERTAAPKVQQAAVMPSVAAPVESATVAATVPAAATPVEAKAQPLVPAATPVEVKAAAPAAATPAPAVTDAAVAAVTKQFAAHPDQAYVEISSDDAKLLFDRGAMFFDARRTSVFEEGHIRGAHNISVWEADLDEKINKVFEENLDPETPIVVYCAGGNCEDSHMLSQRLWGIGLNAVFVYKDGFPDWQAKGRPVSTGAAR